MSGVALREGFDPFNTSLLEFSAFQSAVPAFDTSGFARQQISAVRVGADAIRVQAAAVTAGYLATVGVAPAIGRSLVTSDDRPGANAVALIGHAFWIRHLAGRADVLGQTLVIDGEPTTVIGVMPPGFDLPFSAEIWVPLRLTIEALPLAERLPSAYSLIARLRADASIDRANDETAAVGRTLAEALPQRRGWTYRVVGLRPYLPGDLDGRTMRMIGILAGAVLFLLVICCVNVANLLLLRQAERSRDDAVRLAIGASTRQLAVERFVEHAGIGAAGGIAGVCLSLWIAPILAALNPVHAASFEAALTDFRLDGPMLPLGGVITAGTALVVGLIARVRLPGTSNLTGALASSAPRVGLTNAQRSRLQLLVAAQVAVAVLLLVGGGLIARTFIALRSADVGFRPADIFSTQLTLPSHALGDHRRRAADLDRLVRAVQALPGVSGAAVTTNLPLQRVSIDSFYTVEGRPSVNLHDVPITAHRVVTPGYLELMGMRLIGGRQLGDRDTADAPRVVVVSKVLADRHIPLAHRRWRRRRCEGGLVQFPHRPGRLVSALRAGAP